MNPMTKHTNEPAGTSSFRFRMVLYLLIALLAIGGTSCSSQKRLAKKHAKAARLAQIEQAKADLLEIINDDGRIPFEVKEKKFNDVKNLNLDDKEVKKLLVRAEEKLAKDRVEYLRKKEEELKRKEEELREQQKREAEKRMSVARIQDALMGVATAPDLRIANSRITEALSLFASPDVPVLIIISQEGTLKDYDRPTTIGRYLEFLKDQKRFNNIVENVLYDASGRITELELRKR